MMHAADKLEKNRKKTRKPLELLRKDSLPPIQYPILSDKSTTPIRAVHIYTEFPTNGAIRREADNSNTMRIKPARNATVLSISGELVLFVELIISTNMVEYHS